MKDVKIEKVNPIELDVDGKVYTLDYTRDSIVYAEENGFVLDESFGKKPVTDMFNLFYFAFRAKHPEITREEAGKILDDMQGMDAAFIERLVQLYGAQLNLTVSRGENEKNAKVKVRL